MNRKMDEKTLTTFYTNKRKIKDENQPDKNMIQKTQFDDGKENVKEN